MLSKKITIINKLGLHARASMKLVNTASRYQSNVKIKCRNNELDAKDIMNVMALAVQQGTEIELLIDGPDESDALKALVELIENRFGEEE